MKTRLEKSVLKKYKFIRTKLPRTYLNLYRFKFKFCWWLSRKRNVAFISQSEAYCCAILDWAEKKKVGFSHFISIGNKTIFGEDQLLSVLKDDVNTKIFTFYLENLKNGKNFLKILNEVSKTKPCIILEPGKSQKAKMASLSHTGSLAPIYKIL